jgi:hypothetical protein
MALTKAIYSIVEGAPANILAFGADPTGIADCSAAILAAINSFAADEIAYVELPEGVYRVTNTITVTRPVILRGQGCRIIAAVPNGYVFDLDNAEPSYPGNFDIDGIEFKWSGTFGTSTSGGIKCTDVFQLKITNCIFWGLGLNAINLVSVICGLIERNQFKEHLNTNEIMRCAGTLYLVTIRNNFFAFTSPALTKPCLYMQQSFNTDISGNAFETGSVGIYLSQYGTTYGCSITNNFIESCTIGLALGNDNGDGFFGFFEGLSVQSNVFTSNATGISVAGSVLSGSIRDNSFDCESGEFGIDVASNRYNSLVIEGNNYIDVIDLDKRIKGYAYPFGNSAVDATKTVVDRTDDTTGWTEQFDPSGFGTLTTSTPMPGVNANNSLEMSFSSSPLNQYIVQKTISAVDLSDADFFVVPFWVDDPAKLQNTDLENWSIIRIGPDSSNYWGFNFGDWSSQNTTIVRKGWNIMVFSKADAVIAFGAPASWSAITYIQLRVVPRYLSNPTSLEVRFNGIYGFKLNGVSAFAGAQLL